MQKRCLTLLLTLSLTLCISLPACAADAGQTYSDVAADAWYADAVAYCSEQELMTAMPGGFDFETGSATT